MEPNEIFKAHSLGSQTLVGVWEKKRPHSQGNCFSVFLTETSREDIISGRALEYKIVNFNVENLEALIKLGLTWPIQCKLLAGRTAILHDPRIGERWYDDHFCEVCCPRALLPTPQLQRHEREIMRGARQEHDGFIQINFGKKAEFE